MISEASLPSAACPVRPGEPAPECSRRLELRECLSRQQKEAKTGEVDTGRYRCRYVLWGKGPALMLVPGMGSDALSFVMLMARLQANFLCVSYDLPEGGSDGARLAGYRHEDCTADLHALLDHLGVGECALYGCSFGTTISLSAGAQQPHRFSRMILQGAFARRPLSTAEVFCASWLRFAPGRLGHLPLMRRLIEHDHRAPFRQREQEVWDFFLERQCRVPLRAFASRALMVNRLDLRPILPSIHLPTLLVRGDTDRLSRASCEQELREGIPGAAHAEIERCGHYPHLTHPEVLAELIQQFLLPGTRAEAGHAP